MTHGEPAPGRLRSLDVFRGLTVALMIVVNSPGNHSAYAQLDHSAWNGCTAADLVFPLFLFIVGTSLVISFPKRLARGETRTALLAHAAKRAALLFLLGLFLNAIPFSHERLASLRVLGVLQRIGLCYLLGAALVLSNSAAGLAAWGAGLLAFYWALMTYVPVPGYGPGDLSPDGNLAAFLDRLVLSGHLYRPNFDPEGLLSTLPATATVLLGALTGLALKSPFEDPQKLKGMAAAGAALTGLGLLWGLVFPINKALWTSPYVLFTGGLALLLFAACWWLVDVRKSRRWIAPIEAFGVNALAGYFLSIVFIKILVYTKCTMPDGAPGDLHLLLTRLLFEGWLSPKNASLAFALCFTGTWLAVLWPLYRRHILIKL